MVSGTRILKPEPVWPCSLASVPIDNLRTSTHLAPERGALGEGCQIMFRLGYGVQIQILLRVVSLFDAHCLGA